jgi:hypothetical protein
VTAIARADIGAFRARRKAWVRGCVQMCDDDRLRAAISIGSLLCIRALGTPPAWRSPWLSRVIKGCDQLPILPPDAAGIDVGASELFVAVGADRDPQPVRRFPTFTRDLHMLADWVQQCGVRSVAMPAGG